VLTQDNHRIHQYLRELLRFNGASTEIATLLFQNFSGLNRPTLILLDGTSLSMSMKGVGRYTWQIIEGLIRALPSDCEIHAVVFDGQIPLQSDKTRVRYHRIPYCSEFQVGTSVIPKLLRNLNPTCLIRPADKIGIKYNLPTLTVCHDINPMIWAQQPPRSFKRKVIDAAWEWLRGNALRASDLVVCNSNFIQQAAISHFGLKPEKTAIGYCGVDARIPQRSQAVDSVKCRKQYGPEGFLLTFATGDKREGFGILPPLFEQAIRNGYPGNLVVAGVKKDRAYSQQLTADFDRRGIANKVHILPFLGEPEFQTLVELYTVADFYLETSRHEGFGMQLVEAMSCGTTCFSSGRGALTEVAGGHALDLSIDNPQTCGDEIFAAWKNGLHLRDNQSQIHWACSFDWRQTTEVVNNFALKHIGKCRT
jgi:glycosyltransferase involved in cell wall biosynthesis